MLAEDGLDEGIFFLFFFFWAPPVKTPVAFKRNVVRPTLNSFSFVFSRRSRQSRRDTPAGLLFPAWESSDERNGANGYQNRSQLISSYKSFQRKIENSLNVKTNRRYHRKRFYWSFRFDRMSNNKIVCLFFPVNQSKSKTNNLRER